MQKIWTPQLIEILPESILLDEKLRASAQALDAELEKLSAATREVLHLPRLDELSGLILDHLAEQFHLDFYEPLYLSEEEKKNLIRTSIAWHRIKGTVGAVEQIAVNAFRDAQIEEWQNYGGEPYHFRITTKGYKYTPDGFDTFLRMIWAAKNVRSWLDKIVIDYSDTPILGDDINIYAGIVDTAIGIKNYSLPLPKNERYSPRIGFALVETGDRGAVPIAQPKDQLIKRFIGQALVRGGGITILADLNDLPKRADLIESGIADLLIADVGIVRPGRIKIPVERLEEWHKVPIFSGAALWKTGVETVQDTRPADQKITMHAGQYQHKAGNVTIDFDRQIKLKKQVQVRAGVALVRGGTITIDSETRPSIPPDHRYFGTGTDLNLHTGAALGKLGFVEIKAGPRNLNQRHKIKIHAGHSLIRSGRILIKSSDDGFEEVPDGDWLRLYLDFPTGRDKPVLLSNPRPDLIKGDVKAIGDFAVERDIFRNSVEENTTGIRRVELIRGFKVNGSDDLAKLPKDGDLRVFFDFPTGNKHRVLLHDRKPEITFGELKKLGQFAAENRVLINYTGDATRGISHASLVKKMHINDRNLNEPIKFEE